jgi:hypothetical protein
MNAVTSHLDPLEENSLRAQATFTRDVAEWCLRRARHHMERGDIDSALEWNSRAARTFIRGCRPLVSETLERNLLEIAATLPRFAWKPAPAAAGKRRWLHVLDHALPYGGHTAMVRRWIATNPGNDVHCAALPVQETVPKLLADAVSNSGGEIFLPPQQKMTLLARALWLRKLAYAQADCVVLHIDSDSVIEPVAFGVDGGPPVLLVNHSAHTFWTGVSVIDQVINCRGSQFERYWTQHYRGATHATTLPIPIESPQELAPGQVFSAEHRAEARHRLNLPMDVVVLLSVGREEKYLPVPGSNFFDAAGALLESCPQAWMLVVGPSENDQRRALKHKLNGRLIVSGCQSNLRDYYAAADVYLESFPLGSTTAFLEAGVHGLPCVLAPANCPPPFGTDGVAIDGHLHRPADVEEYLRTAKEFIEDSDKRARSGQALAQSIRSHHCGEGWARYLAALVERMPRVHSLQKVSQPPSPPEEFSLFWTRTNTCFRGDPFFNAVLQACSAELVPAMDGPLFVACRSARRTRYREGWAQAFLPVALSTLLPLFPRATGKLAYRGIMSSWDLKQRLVSFLKQERRESKTAAQSVVAA